jgi:hypothetical protein
MGFEDFIADKKTRDAVVRRAHEPGQTIYIKKISI